MIRSQSREKSLKKVKERVNPSNHEQKLRDALTQGISALDLWKLMGNESDLINSTSTCKTLHSIDNR